VGSRSLWRLKYHSAWATSLMLHHLTGTSGDGHERGPDCRLSSTCSIFTPSEIEILRGPQVQKHWSDGDTVHHAETHPDLTACKCPGEGATSLLLPQHPQRPYHIMLQRNSPMAVGGEENLNTGFHLLILSSWLADSHDPRDKECKEWASCPLFLGNKIRASGCS
jgi:hypothetical protein